MRVVLAVILFIGLAAWVWLDAAASGAITAPIKVDINISYR
jgi:hypothetical protein